MPTFPTKTAADSRDDQLRTIGNLLRARGVANPNLNKGSDDYNWAQAVGNECEALYASLAAGFDQVFIDSAVGTDLDRLLAMFGLARRAASSSTGFGVLSSTAATLIPAGTQLTDPLGNPFTVVTGSTYSNGDSIPVQSVGVGSATNLAGATVLTWVSPPAFAASRMPLDAFGTSNGVDAEDDDTARARLLDRIQNPPEAGNAAFVATVAENVSATVQKAFVYPCANGPGTEAVALAAYATATFYLSRSPSAATVTLVTAAVQAALPEYVESIVTGTTAVSSDLSFLLQLPAYGAGGWVDANPWPSTTGIDPARQYCRVTLFTSTTSIRVESMTAPAVGQSICWVDHNTFRLHTAKILTQAQHSLISGTTPGTFDLTIDTPFISVTGVPIAVNDWVFPAAIRTSEYLAAVLGQYALLGPGEVQLSAGLLPHSYRQPRNYESWDYAIGNKFLRALSDAGSEVLDVAWAYQNNGTTTPALPALITDPPNIFVPRQLGLYAA